MIPLMLGDAPASALKITIRMSPRSASAWPPSRLDTQLVISMATAATTR